MDDLAGALGARDDGTGRRGADDVHRRHARRRLRRPRWTASARGVPRQVPQDGGRAVRLLPGQRLPVLRGRRPARGPLGRRAHRAGSGSRATCTPRTSAPTSTATACWCSTSTTSTRPTSAPWTWDLRRLVASVALLGWSKAFSDADIDALDTAYLRAYLDAVRSFPAAPASGTFALTRRNTDGADPRGPAALPGEQPSGTAGGGDRDRGRGPRLPRRARRAPARRRRARRGRRGFRRYLGTVPP